MQKKKKAAQAAQTAQTSQEQTLDAVAEIPTKTQEEAESVSSGKKKKKKKGGSSGGSEPVAVQSVSTMEEVTGGEEDAEEDQSQSKSRKGKGKNKGKGKGGKGGKNGKVGKGTKNGKSQTSKYGKASEEDDFDFGNGVAAKSSGDLPASAAIAIAAVVVSAMGTGLYFLVQKKLNES